MLHPWMGTGSTGRNWPYEWAQSGKTTEAHYFSTLLAGYQQAATRHNSFYSNMLHKQKDIPAPAKTSFWKHLLTLQKRSKHLVTKHLANQSTVKRIEKIRSLLKKDARPEQVVVKRVEEQQSSLNCNILHKQRSIPAPAETGQTN